MIFINNNDFTEIKVGALAKCVDLIHDGYDIAFSAAMSDHWFIRLQHKNSRRVLIMRVYSDRWTLSDKKKIVLQCPGV